jgi:hypothetical protein
VKALLGAVFLIFVFRVITVALIRPPVFSKRNAKQFLETNYHLIHQGNPDRMQVVAEELHRSVGTIMALAAKISVSRSGDSTQKIPQEQGYAHDFLLLIGDQRFCRIVVDKVPAFAFVCFKEAQKYADRRLPIFQFARNVGQEFIRNTSSSFYQEDSGYYSGLFGYTRPATKIVFGCYEFVEKCAADGASPLETDYSEFREFNVKQMEGYCRASLAFVESCLAVTKGRSHPHSYALARMLDSFESSVGDVYQMDGVQNYYQMPAYGRLAATVSFIRDAIALIEKHAVKPRTFRITKGSQADIYDDLAKLIFETIFAASSVSSPEWTAWSIQHNAVWADIFGFDDGKATKIIALKVRRLLYDEIKRMDTFGNFKGARILGYCLHVLGLTLMDRHKGFRREFHPLQAAVIGWTKANYKRLLSDHPKVAKACLQGSISYESEKHRLAQTYANEIGKEPERKFLEVD